ANENVFIKELCLVGFYWTVFVWFDGSLLNYNAWDQGEPKRSDPDDDLTAMYGPTDAKWGRWFVCPSYFSSHFVCQLRKKGRQVLRINVLITVSEMSALGTNELGIYMDRLSLNVLFARSKIECVYRCFQQHNCLSANFWLAPLTYNSICVLNGATRREDYAVVGTTGESYYGADVSEWKYLELLD
ncbi:hypothetical protein LSH36_412g02059, partial [Paralvinella palmiformis]